MASYINISQLSGIYQIVNKTTEKRYIGYASNISVRLRGHVYDLRKGGHPNDYLQKAWDKYGENDFYFTEIELCEKTILALREDYWVKVLKTRDQYYGYNIRETNPEGKPGCSLETREKLRLKNKGVKPSDYCLQRRRETINSREGKDRQIVAMKKLDWFEIRKHKRKKVIDTVTGDVYESLTILSNLINIPRERLSGYLTGKRTNKTNFKYL